MPSVWCAPEESLAAFALLDAREEAAAVVVYDVSAQYPVKRLPVRLEKPVGVAWLPGRQATLIAAGQSFMVVAAVSKGTDADGEPELQLEFKATRFADPLLSFHAIPGPVLLVAFSKDFQTDGHLRTLACKVLLAEVLPGAQRDASMALVHYGCWAHTDDQAVHIQGAGPSLALVYEQAVCVSPDYRDLRTPPYDRAYWAASGLREAVWEPVWGHFLAGVSAGAVVVLDRAGSHFASWTPVRRQGPSPSGLPVLQALSVAWIGSQRLAVKCGVGSEQNGVWPALLLSTLEFE